MVLKSKREYDITTDETKSRMVSDFIGNTPFVKLSDNLYAKLESVNPGGSKLAWLIQLATIALLRLVPFSVWLAVTM